MHGPFVTERPLGTIWEEKGISPGSVFPSSRLKAM